MRLHAFRKTVAILAIAFACAVLACFLPENAYQRWQLLGGTIHANAKWIYERIHYDPTPIDVAFVGPSRVGDDVDAPRLQAALRAQGLPANVVNFSLPENGRNLAYAIVEEMLKTKRPRLLVVGVIEKPARFGHPAFKYVARPGLIASPGYFGNANYLSDLIYLPFRQMRLFAADVAPGLAGYPKRFDPAAYRGSTVQTTGDMILPDGTLKNRTTPPPMAELMRGVHKLEAGNHPPILPESLRDVEFGDERHFVRGIAALAKARGVKVVFLALPYYTGPEALQEQAFYDGFGPTWNAGFLRGRDDLFADYAHMTSTGAAVVTDWLTPKVAAELR